MLPIIESITRFIEFTNNFPLFHLILPVIRHIQVAGDGQKGHDQTGREGKRELTATQRVIYSTSKCARLFFAHAFSFWPLTSGRSSP